MREGITSQGSYTTERKSISGNRGKAMMVFDEEKLFYEPLEIREKLTEKRAEMSDLQLAMLCGLMKEYKPEKIVEVGAAAGGTTAVILNCISVLGMNTEVYSVDASEDYYRDMRKKTGYLAEECRTFLGNQTKYKFIGGGYLPERLDEIGKEIDFLILDTVHTLPGELLDFLAAFPYLKKGATVVLHDTFLNQHARSSSAFATRVLLSVVAGEKIVGRGKDNPYNYIELGVFKVTQDTAKYIENVFSALMITWGYRPDARMIELYGKFLSRHYQDNLMEEWNMAVEMNRKTILEKREMDRNGVRSIYELIRKLENKENIWIYGCGSIGKKLFALLDDFGIRAEGYIVSDGVGKPCVNQRVEYISDVDVSKAVVVLGMTDKNQKEVCKNPLADHWILIDENMRHFLGGFYQ